MGLSKLNKVFYGSAVLLVISAVEAVAENVTGAAAQEEITLIDTILAGKFVGFIILLASLVALALIIHNFMEVRREKFISPALADQLEEMIGADSFDDARSLCRADDSFMGNVIDAGLSRVGATFGFYDMQNAMQEVAERLVGRYHRRLDYLSFIGAASPMLGLLGTVTGMIRSFNIIAMTQGTATPKVLAGGISEALVTTCLGLIVAIPVMFFVTMFRNRIDSYVSETEPVVDQLMERFRKS